MSNEIKSLKPEKKGKAPPLWTMFLDGAGEESFSYTRVVGFIVVTTFMALISYLSVSSGTLIVPPKEWIYILITFAAMKPVQRFAEAKDNETQLNYDFQMAQLTANTPENPEKPVDKPKQP